MVSPNQSPLGLDFPLRALIEALGSFATCGWRGGLRALHRVNFLKKVQSKTSIRGLCEQRDFLFGCGTLPQKGRPMVAPTIIRSRFISANLLSPLFLLTPLAQKKEGKASLRSAAFASTCAKRKRRGYFALCGGRGGLRALPRVNFLKKVQSKTSLRGSCEHGTLPLVSSPASIIGRLASYVFRECMVKMPSSRIAYPRTDLVNRQRRLPQ